MKVPSGPQQQAGCAHLSGTPPHQLKAAAAATPESAERASRLQTLDHRRDSFESKGLVKLAASAKRSGFVSPLRPLKEAVIDEDAAAASAKRCHRYKMASPDNGGSNSLPLHAHVRQVMCGPCPPLSLPVPPRPPTS